MLALAKTRAPVGVVRAKLAALRATFAASRSPNLEARQLFDLGRSLPPECDALDALTLLDEARATSIELPWPFEQARCDECAGDVLLARGQRAEAVRRYDAALRTCRDYGLLLRVPCIEEKRQRAR